MTSPDAQAMLKALEGAHDWEVRPCVGDLGHVTSWDINVKPEPGDNGVAVIASIYSGKEVAEAILAAAQDAAENHNPDEFVHATPEQARLITKAVERKLASADTADTRTIPAQPSSVATDEVERAAYGQGYRDGFVDAHVTDEGGFPDEEAVLRKLDSTALSDGWANYHG